MSRTARWQRLQALPLVMESLSAPARASFLSAHRTISSTGAPRSKNTEWIRGKIWKGDAPGPADPYTQRPEADAEAAAADDAKKQSNLPAEALESSRPRRDKTPAAVRDTRILLPARRSEATAERDVPAADPTYVPATEADGLEEIGALSTWWDQPGHWGEESEFRGFGRAGRGGRDGAPVGREVLEVHLRRALVEVLALQAAGRFAEWATRRWRAGGRAAMDEALGLGVQVHEGGRATLAGDGGKVAEGLVGEEAAAETEELPEQLTAEEAKGMIKQWDSSWKTVVLDDEMKFALRKRLYQLTGNLIPDARLAAATTIRHVLTLAGKDPKPPKLAESLEKRNAFGGLANVTVHGKKIGAIDKEVAIGRWKVIEEELRKRDLPVRGYGNMKKNKERDWLTGKI
ncbi:hypothetical protein ESCO_005615 [Escovopsis weberi]|uniref:Large ribosomal subunit protein mL50 n=1 Tax=Escovopsis weberi TaxID=150374 RepID=A0A0M8MZ80_ESCWE|nr:hypothetical protein ESCO_005615 [Escovopsis weberi]